MKEKMLVIIVVKNSAVFLVIISEMMCGENKNESKCKSGTLVCPLMVKIFKDEMLKLKKKKAQKN